MLQHKRSDAYNVYNAYNKSNVWQGLFLLVACILLGVFLMCFTSYARYVAYGSGSLEMNVAQWKIKVNGVSLADTAAASKIAVTVIPDAAPSTAIEPGQSGYFEIEIDPDGTETSFTYTVKADIAKSKLPNGMSIDGYSVNGGERIVFAADAEKEVENTVMLPTDGRFTTDDKATVRFYWTWNDVAFDGFAVYDLVVTAAVVQYCGENSEGA